MDLPPAFTPVLTFIGVPPLREERSIKIRDYRVDRYPFLLLLLPSSGLSSFPPPYVDSRRVECLTSPSRVTDWTHAWSFAGSHSAPDLHNSPPCTLVLKLSQPWHKLLRPNTMWIEPVSFSCPDVALYCHGFSSCSM